MCMSSCRMRDAIGCGFLTLWGVVLLVYIRSRRQLQPIMKESIWNKDVGEGLSKAE